MKKIRYLSSEEVEWFHHRILELTGGEPGDLARANLEFLLERVRDIGEGLDADKSIVRKAAFLLHGLVIRHPFINGNKRTAFEVVDAFLELNGYALRTRTDEVYSILSEIGAGRISGVQAEAWIAMNLAKRKKRIR